MPRGTLRLAALLAGALSLGAVGWGVAMLVSRQQRTTRSLQEASSALSQAQGQLTLLDEERQKLAGAYEVLKGRLTTTDEALTQAGMSSAKMTADLELLSRQRAELQRQLEEAKRTAERQLQTLGQQATADRAALEAKLKERDRGSQVLDATIEQLQHYLEQRSSERQVEGPHHSRVRVGTGARARPPAAP